MRKIHFIGIAMLLSGLLTSSAWAATFTLTNNQAVIGEPVSPTEKGVLLRQEDGTYSERYTWESFSEDSLKAMAKANPRIATLVAPMIEPAPTIEEKRAAEKVAIVIKSDYDKLALPAPGGLIKSLFGSGVTLLILFLIYAANIYAGYEVAIFRARPVGLVCGVAAGLPFIGPIIFLCMPTLVEDKSELVQEPVHEKEAYHVGEPPVEETHGGVPSLTAEEARAAALPPTKTFARGQYTFNRRFFETQFASFFSVVRREADHDMELIFQTARGTHTVQRISRITANDLHLQVNEGSVSQEIMVQFTDVQQITLKHKDA